MKCVYVTRGDRDGMEPAKRAMDERASLIEMAGISPTMTS